MPAPIIGLPLPRAAYAYMTAEKWTAWILADRGHGREWAQVFRVRQDDFAEVWRAIAIAVLHEPVTSVRKVDVGISCEVHIALTINARTSRVRSAWHYADTEAAPRLVTAFPTP